MPEMEENLLDVISLTGSIVLIKILYTFWLTGYQWLHCEVKVSTF